MDAAKTSNSTDNPLSPKFPKCAVSVGEEEREEAQLFSRLKKISDHSTTLLLVWRAVAVAAAFRCPEQPASCKSRCVNRGAAKQISRQLHPPGCTAVPALATLLHCCASTGNTVANCDEAALCVMAG
eukprot:scaffold105341_cov63-Phaeocystis_antarctica.AAC.2